MAFELEMVFKFLKGLKKKKMQKSFTYLLFTLYRIGLSGHFLDLGDLICSVDKGEDKRI
jgi:hypothetical protein